MTKEVENNTSIKRVWIIEIDKNSAYENKYKTWINLLITFFIMLILVTVIL